VFLLVGVALILCCNGSNCQKCSPAFHPNKGVTSCCAGVIARTMKPATPAPRMVNTAAQAPLDAKQHEEGRELCCLRLNREANGIALSPDGMRVAVAMQDHSVQIWHTQSEVLLQNLKGHRYWVNSVSFCPDGVHLASGSSDKTVKVWELLHGRCEHTLHGHFLSVAAVAYSDDPIRLASSSWDKTVCLWDSAQGRLLRTFSGHTDWVHTIAWEPGQQLLASGSSDHSVRVWNAISGDAEQVLVGHLQTVTAVTFAKGSPFLASGSLDRSVRLWNVQEGTLKARLQQESDEGSVHCLAFTPDLMRIIAGCSDKSIKVWNFRTLGKEMRFTGHEDGVLGICVNPDGLKLYSCSHDKTIRVWLLGPKRRAPIVGTTSLSMLHGGAKTPGASPNASFKELHDRLRSTEDVNLRLRHQLCQAQSEIEEKTRHAQNWGTTMSDQERQLNNYRNMINSLSAEKAKLESSFEEIRQELRNFPVVQTGGVHRVG